jgi:UDP-N-acetylglucosamine-lysosomal-enzyme
MKYSEPLIEKKRYRDNNELLYSLRSVEKHVPFVRNIFIVTDGQIPSWLNLTHPKIKIITHEQIFRNPANLPSYNSNGIEVNIHRIPGLSRHFLYFNDDFIVGRNVSIEDFWSVENKTHKVFVDKWLFNGTERCYQHP